MDDLTPEQRRVLAAVPLEKLRELRGRGMGLKALARLVADQLHTEKEAQALGVVFKEASPNDPIWLAAYKVRNPHLFHQEPAAPAGGGIRPEVAAAIKSASGRVDLPPGRSDRVLEAMVRTAEEANAIHGDDVVGAIYEKHHAAIRQELGLFQGTAGGKLNDNQKPRTKESGGGFFSDLAHGAGRKGTRG